MKENLVEVYSYFISKLYEEKSYKYFQVIVTKRINITIINFLVELRIKTSLDYVSKDYIFDYCSFQFEYMFSKMPRYKEDRIPFSQIFSLKGIERWLEKSDGYMYYVGEGLQEKGIRRSDIIKDNIITRDSYEIILQEEREKSRYHNQENGLAHCLIATSLYNSKSSWCSSCIFKKTCMEISKKRQLALYIDRKYVQERD